MPLGYLPPGRTGAPIQQTLTEVSEVLGAASATEIAAAVRFLVINQPRIKARSAVREAASRVYAAESFR